MREFTALEWRQITGSGDLAVIGPLPEDDGLRDLGTLEGQHVLIDGKPYRVRSVAMFSPESHRHPFGLLVKADEP